MNRRYPAMAAGGNFLRWWKFPINMMGADAPCEPKTSTAAAPAGALPRRLQLPAFPGRFGFFILPDR